MIIKLSKIINCTSEHPSYPASNLLEHPPKSSWRCAKPDELMATVIFQLAEPSCITGLEIANYRSCIVKVEASTFEEPDKWLPIINYQFLTHDEAVNSKFRDQVQIFTKRELNPEYIKIKFNRLKVTCVQSANPRELFGLKFIILKTEVVVDLGLDIFGRFKLKEKTDEKDEFKEKYFKLYGKKKDYKEELREKIVEVGVNNFIKKQEENYKPKKQPILEKLEADAESNTAKGSSNSTNDIVNNDSPNISSWKKEDKDENSIPIKQILFNDVTPILKEKKNTFDRKVDIDWNPNIKKRPHSPDNSSTETPAKKLCTCNLKPDELCKLCNLLPEPKKQASQNMKKKPFKPIKPKKEFSKLFEDIKFSLSGYVNPQRDEIRRKALKMGAKYIADPNLTNNKCTHLICAFKNTPKYQQFKGHCKILSHKFIENCFDNKKRIPWRRFALDNSDQKQPESEEEIEGTTSPIRTPNIYDQETDDSDTNY